MKIQYLNGGLANQAFQYIFARFAMEKYREKEEVFLDDSFFFVNRVHNGYELEKVFGVKPPLLSRLLNEETWEQIIENKKNGISVCQSLNDSGIELAMVTESSNWTEHNPFNGKVYPIPCNGFYPEILDVPGNIYYHGYWINRSWFDTYREVFLQELRFPAITEPQNIRYRKRMLESESIAVHVRRGDFVSLNLAMDAEYYRRSIRLMREKFPEGCFFIFSDDIEWCKNSLLEIGFMDMDNIVFVEGNDNGNNYIDMQLMGLCKNAVLCLSSFGYLAVLLSEHNTFTINPTDRKI